MANIYINSDKCIGCKSCMRQCPYGAIIIQNKKAHITENCTLCGSCAEACKFNAIVLNKENISHNINNDYNGVCVFAEQYNGHIKNVTYELLGKAIELASVLKTKVSAILLGCNIKDDIETLISYGADKVYAVDSQLLKNPNEQIYPDIIEQIVKKYKPEIFLIGATSFGRSIAPRIASNLNTGLTADCTGLEIDTVTGLLLQTRPAFGGNLMATIVCTEKRPQMATVRPKVLKSTKPDESRKGEITYPDIVYPDDIKIKILKSTILSSGRSGLSDADIVVSAGMGIGSEKNMEMIKDLADILDAGIGASRAIVDVGWAEYSCQIGQTGKTVAPKIYIACGISGAIQHLAGISRSCFLIAINKDKDAPIFKSANIGIIGDCTEIIPKLITQLKSYKKEKDSVL